MQGKRSSDTLPAGYRREGGQVVVDREEAAAVRRLFAEAVAPPPGRPGGCVGGAGRRGGLLLGTALSYAARMGAALFASSPDRLTRGKTGGGARPPEDAAGEVTVSFLGGESGRRSRKAGS